MAPRKKAEEKPATKKKQQQQQPASAATTSDNSPLPVEKPAPASKKRPAAVTTEDNGGEKPAAKKRATATATAAVGGGGGDEGGMDAAEVIMGYLRKVNRPYSAIEISANLHNKVTKAATAKILKDLHERNQLEGRAAGKQIVYHVHQDPNDAYSPEELAALDTTINELRTNTTTLTATAKTLRSSLSSLNSTLSTADLIANVQALETEKNEIVGRLDTLKAGKAEKVTKKERDEVEKEWKSASMISKRRERIAVDMWKFIEDMVEGKEKREELRESLGLDE